MNPPDRWVVHCTYPDGFTLCGKAPDTRCVSLAEPDRHNEITCQRCSDELRGILLTMQWSGRMWSSGDA